MDDYVPLWVKSSFSFLEGASQPDELVAQAHELGLPAVAITDRDGVYGVVHAYMKAKELGMRLVLGAELNVHGGQRVVALCMDRDGYGNLCQLISRGRQRSKKGESVVGIDELCELGAGLCVLCPTPDLLALLHASFGDRLYALIVRHLRADEEPREQALRARARALGVATVAGSEVLYHSVARQPLHDVLTCIRHGVKLSEAGKLIRPNAEHALKGVHAMRQLFADDLSSLERTREVAQRCAFSLASLRYKYPGERLPDGKSERDWLRELTLKGAQKRFPNGTPEAVSEQIDKELAVIFDLEYGGYFLTMYEIVQFCRQSNILCQGRGSAANSAVCFCLGITAVDPIKLDLLFERFLSRERAEPPDIDLDIEHERREEVIQWVYERYGRRHAAMVANVIRYRLRSAMRDVGKVMGLPETAIDRLSKLMGGRFEDMGKEALVHAGLDPEAPVHASFMRLCDEIRDFPRHLSIHPGGFLLGHEPVDRLVPIEPATMEERTVIQWDKYSVEDLGLFKVDLLGLGALSQIHRCFDMLREQGTADLEMASIPHDDPETYAMITRGDTVGVFQIESRAQMSMLPRLRPRTFYDLVIEVAIVRPGPIQGDMVHPYLKRRSGEELPEYPHPMLRRVLEKTLGVPIFQEQVMKIAVLVGGYTPGESDQLRRDMAAWKSTGRIERHHDRLVNRMIENGIAPDFAERIFSQVRGFGEYGFPESHAASFALIAYVTAWLRCHYPAAFACSLLNAQPMGFYAPATIVEDAKRHGVKVLPVDVQQSAWDCVLVEDDTVRMGLRYVKGLGEREKEALKWAPPPYRSLEDFVARTKMTRNAYAKLAEAGALDCLVEGRAGRRDGLTIGRGTRPSRPAGEAVGDPPTREGRSAPASSARRDALWAVRELHTRLQDSLVLPASPGEPARFTALSSGEEILWDYRRSHHSTRGHPIESIRSALTERGIPTAKELNKRAHGTHARYVGMTICRQRPGTATGVTFYTLEDETGFVNLVVWTQVFDKYTVLARTALLLGVTGRLQVENNVVHLIADELWDPELSFAGEGTTTRSFH